MSRVEIIAKMLGVEIGEEFKMKGTGNTRYSLNREKGLIFKLSFGEWEKSHITLDEIINSEIIKLPWKPKKGDRYYYLSPACVNGYTWGEFVGHNLDHRIMSRVDIYRTEEEAIAKVKEKGWVVE